MGYPKQPGQDAEAHRRLASFALEQGRKLRRAKERATVLGDLIGRILGNEQVNLNAIDADTLKALDLVLKEELPFEPYIEGWRKRAQAAEQRLAQCLDAARQIVACEGLHCAACKRWAESIVAAAQQEGEGQARTEEHPAALGMVPSYLCECIAEESPHRPGSGNCHENAAPAGEEGQKDEQRAEEPSDAEATGAGEGDGPTSPARATVSEDSDLAAAREEGQDG
jgi:hypothetical protein